MRRPTHRKNPAHPSGASAAPVHSLWETFPRRLKISYAAAASTAAATAKPFGRASPAQAARAPAHTQRPVRTAYSDQAAKAVRTGSVYAIESTTECGSRPHRRTRVVATARSCSRAPIA